MNPWKNVSSFSFSFDAVHSFCSGCRDGQELVLWQFVVFAALILAAIIIGYILLHVFLKRKAYTCKMTEKRNQNGKQYVDDEAMTILGWCELELFYKLQNNA